MLGNKREISFGESTHRSDVIITRAGKNLQNLFSLKSFSLYDEASRNCEL
jgi:hypothetical protein